jgi:hypothetical protein
MSLAAGVFHHYKYLAYERQLRYHNKCCFWALLKWHLARRLLAIFP